MTDRFVVRSVVLGLALAVLACIVAAVVLALNGTDLPEFLKYVGTTALGAFAGVLSKTSTEVQPVAVVDQPVATVDVPAKKKRGDKGHTDLDRVIGIAALVLVLLVICDVLAS